MNRTIPYGKQEIDEDDIQAVVDTLKSDYLTTGPKVLEFEEKFAEYVGAKYAVSFSNGTAALHGACYAAGIQSGDEVITSAITFAATANAVLYCGGVPVFADICEKTYNIDPNDVRLKVTDKTKAIIPVHFTGQPCDMDAIKDIANQHGLVIIEDAAHALGASYKGKRIGSIADMTTFSFHPVKHITTGEGGMVTTNSYEYYEKLLLFRTHGITRSEDLFTENSHGSWYYEQLDLGYNFRLSDIQCALGISQLKKLDYFLDKRHYVAQQYYDLLAPVKEIILPYQAESGSSSWHLFVIKINGDFTKRSRKDVVDCLREKNILANVHYIPVYYFPYYQKLGYKRGLCPKAEKLYENIITLPLYTSLTETEINYIVETLKSIFN